LVLHQFVDGSAPSVRAFHYEENPFASRITYRDPLDYNHFVLPNLFFCLWHGNNLELQGRSS
jgi:hypothetical protein